MKVSVYQKIARVMITVMVTGGIVLLTINLAGVLSYVLRPPVSDFVNPIYSNRVIDGLISVLLPLSFLLQLLGYVIWTMICELLPPIVGAVCAIIIYLFLLGCMVFALVSSKYLTRFRGTRSIIALNLALIVLDLPIVVLLSTDETAYIFNGFEARSYLLYIGLVLHLIAAFFLVKSLIYTKKHDLSFSDFRPSPAANRMRSAFLDTVGEEQDERTIRSARNKWLIEPRVSRVLTVIIGAATLVGTIAQFGAAGSVKIWSNGALIGSSITFFAGSPLYWFYSTPDYLTLPFSHVIMLTGCLLVFISSLLIAQRFFTRDSWLTKPALIFVLTIAVLDTLPFLSPLIFTLPTVVFHGFWIAELVISLEKISPNMKEDKKNTE